MKGFLCRLQRAVATGIAIATLQIPASGCVRPIRVAIDIGHTPRASGTPSAVGKTEYSFNKRFVEEFVHSSQIQPDITLIVINPKGREISLIDRTEIARAAGANLFISIHHDSTHKKYWQERSVDGTKQIYSYAFRGYSIFVSSENRAYQESLEAARIIGRRFKTGGLQPSLHHAEPIEGERKRLINSDLGIYDAPFAVLRHAASPSILIELGVLIHPDEEKLLDDRVYRSKAAEYLRAALQEYCSILESSSTPSR